VSYGIFFPDAFLCTQTSRQGKEETINQLGTTTAGEKNKSTF